MTKPVKVKTRAEVKVIIAGSRSYPLEELRLRADNLRMDGRHDDADLLHRLLDSSADQTTLLEYADRVKDVESDLREMNNAADKVTKLIREALRLLPKLKGAKEQAQMERAIAALEEAREKLQF